MILLIRQETEYMEARIAKPGKILTMSYFWVFNFKPDERNTKFKLENRKLTLNNCNTRYSLNVKNSFVKHAKILR